MLDQRSQRVVFPSRQAVSELATPRQTGEAPESTLSDFILTEESII
jgi:hypothetical protein